MKNYDELTNLLNRSELYKVTNIIFKEQNRINTLYIDINEFIWINHIYGHLKGDEILIKLGEMLLEFVDKNEEFVFRIGGDEFIILYPKLSLNEVTKIAKRIFNRFKNYIYKK